MGVAGLPSVELIGQRLVEIEARIERVAVGDRPVRVIGVTKGFPVELAERARLAGLDELGENYGQELSAKAQALGASFHHPAGPVWHFIGGLQRNKIRHLAELVALWQTIDRTALIDELAKRAPGARILVQVNTTGEPQKSGCEPDAAEALVDHARSQGLTVEGLMTIGPTLDGDPRPCFERLASLGDTLGLAELSMGMSGDFEDAVACGATMVRLGSVLFGPRPSRKP